VDNGGKGAERARAIPIMGFEKVNGADASSKNGMFLNYHKVSCISSDTNIENSKYLYGSNLQASNPHSNRYPTRTTYTIRSPEQHHRKTPDRNSYTNLDRITYSSKSPNPSRKITEPRIDCDICERTPKRTYYKTLMAQPITLSEIPKSPYREKVATTTRSKIQIQKSP
jgi:hypothetical protein